MVFRQQANRKPLPEKPACPKGLVIAVWSENQDTLMPIEREQGQVRNVRRRELSRTRLPRNTTPASKASIRPTFLHLRMAAEIVRVMSHPS